jgi:hypothetical protein
MRKLIFAINITLDGCCDHTKQFVDEEQLEYLLTSRERLICRSLGVKPIN